MHPVVLNLITSNVLRLVLVLTVVYCGMLVLIPEIAVNTAFIGLYDRTRLNVVPNKLHCDRGIWLFDYHKYRFTKETTFYTPNNRKLLAVPCGTTSA